MCTVSATELARNFKSMLDSADVATVTGNKPVYLLPVTIAELKFGAENAVDDGIRQKRLAALARLKRKPLLIIDETTGEIFGDLAFRLKKRAGPQIPGAGPLACEPGDSAWVFLFDAQPEGFRRYPGTQACCLYRRLRQKTL